jgi:hypothetical protein
MWRYIGHNDFLNKIDTSSCNKYLLTSAGDGLRFFDLASLKPLGGWKTSSIPEVSSFIKDGKNYFLFGDSSLLYVLTEDTMLANAHSTHLNLFRTTGSRSFLSIPIWRSNRKRKLFNYCHFYEPSKDTSPSGSLKRTNADGHYLGSHGSY